MPSNFRVLLVDADEVALFRARRLLADAGIELSTATSGRAARELLRARAATMIFAALRLADGDGFSFLVDVRHRSRGCPCVLYSSGLVPALPLGHDIPVLEVPAPIEAIVEIASAMCRAGELRLNCGGFPRL